MFNRSNSQLTLLVTTLLLISLLALSGCFAFSTPASAPASDGGDSSLGDNVEVYVNEAASDRGESMADESSDAEAAMEESVAVTIQAAPSVDQAQTSNQAKTSNQAQSVQVAIAAPTATPAPQPTIVAQQEPAREEPEVPTDMFFQDYGVNPFVNTTRDNLSTFAMDVDTGSYTIMRNYVTDGLLPPMEAVRVEEFVNYFDYEYTMPTSEEVFAIQIDAAPAPFAHMVDNQADQNIQVQTVRVGIQGVEIDPDERQNVALTFVVDVSGSMDQENRITLAKRSLNMLVEELRPTDSVSLVAYGDSAYVILPPTPASEKNAIAEAIFQLTPGGSTNAEAGLTVGYEMAWNSFNPQINNRLVLISDGVANVGETTPGSIWHQVEQYAEQGITLTSVGVGMGNYNDVLLEQLANMGDGTYSYVDTIDEARRIFVDELTGTLQTIAKDAKVQVEFNQKLVTAYRLIGYENRDVADEDFRDDTVDAGEIGAGHSVTALYEVVLNEQAEIDLDAPLLTVSLRWLDPETEEPTETTRYFQYIDFNQSFTDAPADFQLAATVAEYAEILRASHWTVDTSVSAALTDEVIRIGALMEDDEKVEEFVELITIAQQLAVGR